MYYSDNLNQRTSSLTLQLIDGKMVKEPGKVLCSLLLLLLLLAILGVDPAQNLAQYKRLCVLIQLTNSSIAIM